MPKAIEISVVYEDGTGLRLEGLDAAALGRILDTILVSTGIGTPYKPLRKVVEVEGRLVSSYDDPEPYVALPRDAEGLLKSASFASLPAGVVFSDWGTLDEDDYVGPLYRIRSVVEVTPVEETKP